MDKASLRAIIRAAHKQTWNAEEVFQVAYLAYKLGHLSDDGSISAEDRSQEVEVELAKLGVDTAKLDSRFQ
jgi:hypothetical protein